MNDLEIIDCEQGTPEWLAARAGIITASVFNVVQMKGRGGGVSETRRKLMHQLAAETITGMPCPQWGGNEHTERGKVMEAEVRALYEASSEAPVQQVGFLRRGRLGASPDSLVGDDGLLEIKTKLPGTLSGVLGTVPRQHAHGAHSQLPQTVHRLPCLFPEGILHHEKARVATVPGHVDHRSGLRTGISPDGNPVLLKQSSVSRENFLSVADQPDTQPGKLLHGKGRALSSPSRCGDGPGDGMVRPPFCGGRRFNQFTGCHEGGRMDLRHPEHPPGEGARLVEENGLRAGQGFQHIAPLQQNPPA